MPQLPPLILRGVWMSSGHRCVYVWHEPNLYFSGVNTMANYEQVLHLIRYKNWHTEALFDRKFKLVCSELNGRYISNDFKVEVSPSCYVSELWHFATAILGCIKVLVLLMYCVQWGQFT